MQRFSRNLSWAVVLAAVPALLLAAGCDSGGDDPPPSDPVTSANYDTTEVNGTATISITENGSEGITPVDEDGNFIGDGDENSVTWSNDYEYVLNGRVFVNDGQTLTIEEGTVVRGDVDFNDPANASALIVAQGGTIDAVGTPDDPIIFTAEGQPTDDYNFELNEQWGGVIILGTAPNNVGDGGPGLLNVEGIPTDVSRGRYGCGEQGVECDPDDDSGTFRYVSIRHGGTSIGAGNEIQGLTLGSVGSGTTIDHVEVMANLDDGFEWFGGTVNMSHLVTAFIGDDSFDIDQGYSGKLQYLLAVQGEGAGDRGGEHDGGDSGLGGEDSEPLADPQICNATYLGADAGSLALMLRDNFAGDYYNSIFSSFPNGFIEIEDLASGADSRGRFENGELNLEGNILTGYDDADSFADVIQLTTDDDGNIIDESFRAPLAEHLADNNRLNVDVGVTAYDGSSVDPTPNSDAIYDNLADTDACLEDANYAGAFDGSDNWAEGWTTLSQAGVFE